MRVCFKRKTGVKSSTAPRCQISCMDTSRLYLRTATVFIITTLLALVRTLSLQAYPLLDLLPHGPLGGGAVRARGDAPSDLACGVLHLEGDLNGVRVRVRVGVRVGVRVRVRVGVRVSVSLTLRPPA